MEDIDLFLKNIPACLRCRQRHRKCDSSMPKCHNCTSSDLEDCLYYDHILDQEISRRSLLGLVERLRHLRATATTPAVGLKPVKSSLGPGCMRNSFFTGSSSCISGLSPVSENFSAEGLGHLAGSELQVPTRCTQEPILSPRMHKFLIGHYRATIHAIYPILEDTDPCLNEFAAPTECLMLMSPNKRFIQFLIYSTSCASLPCGNREAQAFVPLSDIFHEKAIHYYAEATTGLTIQTLQALALLAINSLLAPHRANFSQTINIAARMCQDLNLQESEDEKQRNLFLSILCMERQACLTLDRPWFLPTPQPQVGCRSSHPIEILWQILSLQSILRDQDDISPSESTMDSIQDTLRYLRETCEAIQSPHGNLLAVLEEAELTFAETSNESEVELRDSISDLIMSYSNPSFCHTFLAPIWTFRALRLLLKRSSSIGSGRASSVFHRGLLILDRSALKWPSYSLFVDLLLRNAEEVM